MATEFLYSRSEFLIAFLLVALNRISQKSMVRLKAMRESARP